MNDSTVCHPRRGVFFCADLHLMHESVATKRGFPDSISHDNHVIDTWRRHVHPEATVWVLGDLTLESAGKTEAALLTMRSLPGAKHLVLGNHDVGHPLHAKPSKFAQYLMAFESIQTQAKVGIGGRDVMLSHFPYVGDSGPTDRHTAWRLRNEGRPLLHGHVHAGRSFTYPDNVIHVGWDAWFRPVHADEVNDLLH